MLFTTICFVGLYSMPNLIVIIFNLVYLVFIVGFHCKGCVIERVVWRLKHLKTGEGFASILRLSIPRSISCAMHMLECEESGQMETTVSCKYLAGKAFPRDTRKAFCSASLSSLIHTFSAYTIYTHITHKCKGEPNTLRVRDCYTHNPLHICFGSFLISYLFISIPLRGW